MKISSGFPVKSIISLLLLLSSPAMADEKPASRESINKPSAVSSQGWLNLGLGAGGDGTSLAGPTVLISGNYRLSEHQILSARFLQTHQLLFDGSRFTDAGLMYGLIAKGKYAYISGSAGLGFAQYDHHKGGLFVPDRHVKTTNTIGIPLELKLFLIPTPYVGIGVIGFGNLNTARSIAGVALGLQVGYLE
ncbi:hypothetical protein AQUSIP_08100 [Aquicella siphonis]|uniref:Outer membrane protein beta-barrel domain-containing protein n=1 Tax=Aquicella siphonis TaxID=254247 RepID=A0A5E4PEW1_9COXI|nr:hypothetical protein [Aquicella siphonis]VVC75520.1 hypothetical protein AQUSIP_08100 [Aquicella siphonis]